MVVALAVSGPDATGRLAGSPVAPAVTSRPGGLPASPGAGGHGASPSPSGASVPAGSGDPTAPGTKSVAPPAATGSPTGAPSPTTPVRPGAGEPLALSVRSHVWQNACDHTYLSERGPQAVPAPPVEQDAPAWAAAQRAVHARQQIVEVTATGKGAGPVVLQAVQVRVVARRAPLKWNVYAMSPGCGGALTPATYAVNLDAPRPLARPVEGSDAGEPVPAPTLPLRVSAQEPAVLRVEATTTGCDCDWYLELRWAAGERSGTARIGADGGPFRTSAAVGRPTYGYAYELGRWSRG